ncbi:ATP-binding cassette subfamily G member 4-like [Cylas formicarius]|uniref:ATP-binding cassette subfamily G member 4-like n=1 Tax=Cylas formicarius TaxID=197179 RepID=UPI002958C425|nr:ATP-binding cassette subfamily G member 4-like [Cylas formicarius]
MECDLKTSRRTACRLSADSRIDIEFQDLSYTVPEGRNGSKLILRSVNGRFQSGELSAILGPSGAGKSTLLNVLAGYKVHHATGQVSINGRLRNLKDFGKISRYIMQDDLVQPMLTVQESMMVAANLKLDLNATQQEKCNAIQEILDLLRLTSTVDTRTTELSGGQRKRLSIALELLNNPPVLFLDEPTTGLDDLSCSQCIALLKQIALGGRTVVCSIHTPSASIFSKFDSVYIMSMGQCIYQGFGLDVVFFLSNLDLHCPKHYNPADFIIEVASGEYGNYQEKLVSTIDNGRIKYCEKNDTRLTESERKFSVNGIYAEDDTPEIHSNYPKEKLGWMQQYKILLMRMWVQMWRDKCYMLLRVILHIITGVLIGNVYLGMGVDGSKTLFVFGFYFICLIFFMYIPMMPCLLQFPREFQLIKREHFNKWYRLSAYFAALTTSTLPVHLVLGCIYVMLVYFLTNQPMELNRLSMFYFICMMTAVISESLGLLIASQFSIVNSVFVGPVIAVPFMLLAVYGFGGGYYSIPKWIRIAMYCSYLRYSLEGLIQTMLTGREKLACPEHEEFCIYTDLEYFVKEIGMQDNIIWIDIAALVVIYLIFRGGFYYLLRQRLSPNKTFIALAYVGRLVKAQFAR